ncbi:hypothetical protein [Kocuria sp. KD4]|uniref:hypothetical protein n=1 Tax=Kocuria sp. KD4 TaxID=2719588 RepID=UPI00142790C5|nr:hypothetical protein [Kocuria sp. KD4]QIR69332.1 hypothetical protein HBK84_04010 [Kocuria sp. KD4]
MIERRSVQYVGVLHWHARWGRLVFIAVTLVGFRLSFLPFTELVTKVFPVIGWLGVLFMAVLLVTWLVSARTHIAEEGLRGDLIRTLLLYRLDPNRRWTPRHANALVQAVDEFNLRAMQLGDVMSSASTRRPSGPAGSASCPRNRSNSARSCRGCRNPAASSPRAVDGVPGSVTAVRRR